MAFVVVYDACVLYPAPLRDLLMRLGASGLVQAKWTDKILDECFANLKEARPDLKDEALARTRALMNAAVRDCLVTGYEGLIDGIALPDADDRHVVAAAIRSAAQVIVTGNLKDFPADALASFDAVVMAGNVMIFVQPGTEGAVLERLAGLLAPGGLLIAGFQLRPDRIALPEYDALAAAAGLEPVARWSTWERGPFAGGDYAVSVHRRPA